MVCARVHKLLALGIGLAFICAGAEGLTWITDNGVTFQTCVNETLAIVLNYKLDKGEAVSSQKWSYGGPVVTTGRKRAVAYAIKNLKYADKTDRGETAEYTILNAQTWHSGSYNVTLNAKKGRSDVAKKHSRAFHVKILEPPRLRKGQLTATVANEVGKLNITCGKFEYRGRPAVDVIWTLPSGKNMPSTSYEDGVFRLVMDSSGARKGQYKCSPNLQEYSACFAAYPELSRPATVSANPLPVYQSCQDTSSTGVYYIEIENYGTRRLMCYHDTNGNPWTVFQNRFDGSVSFARTWHEYQDGFGDPDGEYWLGLEPLYHLTKDSGASLLIRVQNFTDNFWFWTLSDFAIASRRDKYRLTISSLLCRNKETVAGMKMHSEAMFSTKDKDNDMVNNKDCSNDAGGSGGWWYNRRDYCFDVNLNGRYYRSLDQVKDNSGIYFYFNATEVNTFKASMMMVSLGRAECPFSLAELRARNG